MRKKKNAPNKRPKGWYCFARDLLSSQRYRRCSWATKGVYFDTLNVLSLQSHPGALCLKDFDLKPKSERSLTFRCLQCQRKSKNGEYQSLKYFAEAIAVSASGPRPGLIHGLQELYLRGIIVIEGDTLIQPRMYRDNGFDLSDIGEYMRPLDGDDIMVVAGSPDDGEADPDAERMRLGEAPKKGGNDNDEKSAEKGAKNPRVGAGDARAHSESESKSKRNNNNIIDSKGIGKKGGMGENAHETPDETPSVSIEFAKENETDAINNDETDALNGGETGGEATENPVQKTRKSAPSQKTAENTPTATRTATATATTRTAAGRGKPTVADNPPTLEEVQAYWQEQRNRGKPFRYVTPEAFFDACEQSGWRLKDGKPIRSWQARARTFETFRKEHGDRPVYDEQGNITISNEATTGHYQHYQPNAAGHRATGGRAGGDADHPDNLGIVEQSVRIMRQLREEAQRGADDEVF